MERNETSLHSSPSLLTSISDSKQHCAVRNGGGFVVSRISVLLLTVCLIAGVACQDSSNTSTNTAPHDSQTAIAGSSGVTYQVAARQDVSFGATKRIVYRVVVSGHMVEADLKRITDEIIKSEKKRGAVNAIGFFFYLPGTDTSSVYTAGKADWAPNGDWSQADSVKTGDYSKNRLGAIDLR